jgi:hypothetical protein
VVVPVSAPPELIFRRHLYLDYCNLGDGWKNETNPTLVFYVLMIKLTKFRANLRHLISESLPMAEAPLTPPPGPVRRRPMAQAPLTPPPGPGRRRPMAQAPLTPPPGPARRRPAAVEGKSYDHDRAVAGGIAIRRPLRGHNDTACGGVQP